MSKAQQLRENVARAIWNVMREYEDRCDMELVDMGEKHHVWEIADAAIAASSEQQAALQDAERWRTLINLPGASKRIWNHVLDDSVKFLGNGVAEVLDAARASNVGKA